MTTKQLTETEILSAAREASLLLSPRRALESLEAVLADLSSQQSSLIALRQQLPSRQAELREAIEKANAAIEAAAARRAAAEDRAHTAAGEVDRLERQKRALQSDVDGLTNRKETLAAELKRLETRATTVREALATAASP